MKREIKFRAWDKAKRRMLGVEQLAFGPNGELVSIYSDGPDFSNDSEALMGEKPDLNEAVLMQYTGLHDKNGREIYEGDIVRTGEDNIGDPESMIGQAIMREGSWLIENEKKQEAIELFSEITSREVIGNIFENPELLEGKHE